MLGVHVETGWGLVGFSALFGLLGLGLRVEGLMGFGLRVWGPRLRVFILKRNLGCIQYCT